MMQRKDSQKKSAIKSIVWRIVGVLTLGAVTYYYTGNWVTTSWITFLHHSVFLIVFYLHERFWFYVNIRNMLVRSVVKCITYETILGNFILGIITLAITGDIQQMTQITLTYIGIKHLMYIGNEFIWGEKAKKVYTYVVADILHEGHLQYLEKAREYGYHLSVGVLTDKATMEKKPKPILSLPERMRLVGSLKTVDAVFQQDSYSPLENIRFMKPDIVIESDSHKASDIEQVKDLVNSYGGIVVTLPYYKGQSSTNIKKVIKEKWINKKLGS